MFFFYFGKGISRTLEYLELEAYSELWYIQNPSIFRTKHIQNPGIFRTFAYLKLEAYSELWYIQNLMHIQNIVKYLRWNVLQK